MKKRVVVTAAFVILSMLGIFLLRGFAYRQRLERNLPLVHENMQEHEVVALLGRPANIARPCWSHRPGCSYDYVYPIPFELAGYWVISFDESKRMIEKFEWHSP